MDFKKLLENKPLLYSIIGGLVIIVVLSIALSVGNANKSGEKAEDTKIYKEELRLLTTDNIGKALEIQALLARVGIDAQRTEDGSKSTIVLKDYTMTQRDQALLTIVQSGLVDEHMGLEVFDKGDFTSTKDDKRIRLARAINGELSRLIRKIDPIENASVFVSIPEQTMFTSMKKPTTATVQITIPSGDKLDQTKIKAIKNLLLGSIEGIQPENISITDTNGNTYTSIMSAQDDMLAKVEENDRYMEQKVRSQLDKIVGKGNYVATVSTYLREAPIEKSSLVYDPNRTGVLASQKFAEKLGDQSKDENNVNHAVSSYLPAGLPNEGANSISSKAYSRAAEETQYGVTKTQITEYQKPGTIEEISIAITLDQNSVPVSMSMDELKALIASAASPKAIPENVKIAYSDALNPALSSDRPVQLPKPEASGNPWWVIIVAVFGSLVAGFMFISSKIKEDNQKQQQQLEELAMQNRAQRKQLEDINHATAALAQKQNELKQAAIEQTQKTAAIPELQKTIGEIKSSIENADEDEVIEQLKSWIEKD